MEEVGQCSLAEEQGMRRHSVWRCCSNWRPWHGTRSWERATAISIGRILDTSVLHLGCPLYEREHCRKAFTCVCPLLTRADVASELHKDFMEDLLPAPSNALMWATQCSLGKNELLFLQNVPIFGKNAPSTITLAKFYPWAYLCNLLVWRQCLDFSTHCTLTTWRTKWTQTIHKLKCMDHGHWTLYTKGCTHAPPGISSS